MNPIEEYNRWLNSKVVSENDKNILKKMSDSEIDDAFFKNVEFGTGGMRGILGPGTNRLNIFTVRKATIGLAIYLLEKYPNAKNEGVVISHDNRHMSREFTLLTAKVLSEFGIKTFIFDSLRPTPELSFAVRYVKACGGVMITASHNPKEHNGYKIYDETGSQLVPEQIQRLVDIISELPNELDVSYVKENKLGEVITLGSDVDDNYVHEVEKIAINKDLTKNGFKIVFSPNHGTSYVNAMRVFKDLRYDVYPLLKQCTPDPDFSETLSPNPEDSKSFIEPIKYAKEINADLIVMTDPDGDRCGLAYKNRNGEYITLTGNQSAAMLMDYIFSEKKKRNILSKNGVVYNTIVTSSIGNKICETYGIKLEQFLTGFKFIGNRIGYYEKLGNGPVFEFGYEESYGCLISPTVRDKDAIQAVLMYSEMALFYHLQGKNLGEVWLDLGKRFGYYEDVLYSLKFDGSQGLKIMNDIMEKIRNNPYIKINEFFVTKYEDYLKQEIAENNRVLPINLPKSNVIKLYFNNGMTIAIRPSGTEAKIKFYIGVVGKTFDDTKNMPKMVFDQLKKILNID